MTFLKFNIVRSQKLSDLGRKITLQLLFRHAVYDGVEDTESLETQKA